MKLRSQHNKIFLALLAGGMVCQSCSVQTNKRKMDAVAPIGVETPVQLTHDLKGHCLNTTQSFSPDDQWLVYDTRNEDSMIGSTGSVEMVNVNTGEMRLLYKTTHQTRYGPGVGAVTFNPVFDEVLFIHGIRNANAERPYGFTRRTGVMIDIKNPGIPIFMDARNIIPPFTAGALRGGTHAHTWSGDGKWISFTYNDDVIAKLSASGSSIKDLRTIGVMYPGKPVTVPEEPTGENNNGKMFAVVVVPVTENPKPGSDEISKAFDECWIGKQGYIKEDGNRQEKAIAFQGHAKDLQGNIKTDVFIADLPEDLSKARPDLPLQGTINTRPNAPRGVEIRRVTRLAKGISPVPRHWLRSTPDGALIGFLQQADDSTIQLFAVSPNGGKVKQITSQPFSIEGPFNFSADGKYVAYIADNSVFVTDISTGHYTRLTTRTTANKLVGAVVWSNKGHVLAWNAYTGEKEKFLQVFLMKVKF